jgi:hypothetical protein
MSKPMVWDWREFCIYMLLGILGQLNDSTWVRWVTLIHFMGAGMQLHAFNLQEEKRK